jgi:hypothetical protein
LLELAAKMPLERFEDVLDGAIVGRLVTMDRLEKRARELRAPRRPGCAVVLRLLEERHPELGRARNEMEAKVLRALDRLGAPRPSVNLPILLRGERRIIDFAWHTPKIALELDGFLPHSTRRVFDDDRVRRNLFTAEGWRMYHVTKAALQRSAADALGWCAKHSLPHDAPVLRVVARAMSRRTRRRRSSGVRTPRYRRGRPRARTRCA